MKIGEKAILKCRADYAYGDSPPVSPPAPLAEFLWWLRRGGKTKVLSHWLIRNTALGFVHGGDCAEVVATCRLCGGVPYLSLWRRYCPCRKRTPSLLPGEAKVF